MLNTKPTPAKTLIGRSLATHLSQGWKTRHNDAWRFPQTKEAPIVNLVLAFAAYADNHSARFDSKIGFDGVLGPAWADIGQSIITLLNGEIGRLDGGIVDGLVHDIMAEYGVDPDTGECFFGEDTP
jgi:hypothetical protein